MTSTSFSRLWPFNVVYCTISTTLHLTGLISECVTCRQCVCANVQRAHIFIWLNEKCESELLECIKAVLSSEPFYVFKASNKSGRRQYCFSQTLVSYCIYVLSCMVYSEWIPAATSHKQCMVHCTVPNVMVWLLFMIQQQYGTEKVLELTEIGGLFSDSGLI